MKKFLFIVLATYFFKPDFSKAQYTLNLTFTISPPSCNTCCDGSFTVDAAGCVTSMFLYAPFPPTWTVTTPNNYYTYFINGVCTGTYNLGFSGNENCPYSNYVFTMPLATGIASYYGEQPQVKIYPNPVMNFLVIESQDAGTLIVFDITGKYVLDTRLIIGQNKLITESLEAGVYFIKAVTANGTFNSSLVKLE